MSQSAAPVLSIVVLNFRTPEQAIRAADSALKSAAGLAIELVVVDNGSNDGSAALIGERCPSARIVQLPRNAGFAAGMNAGIGETTGQYIMLLNSDVEVADGSVLELVSYLRDHPDVGMAAPVIRNSLGNVRRSLLVGPTVLRVLIPWLGKVQYRMWHRRIRSEPLDVDVAEGCAVMVSRAAIDRAGLMDESFFVYHEIVDWCLRLRDVGFGVSILPNAAVAHECGATTRKMRHAARIELKRSEYQLIAKRLGHRVRALAVARDVLGEACRIAVHGFVVAVSLGKASSSRQRLASHMCVLAWIVSGMPGRDEPRYIRMFGGWD